MFQFVIFPIRNSKVASQRRRLFLKLILKHIVCPVITGQRGFLRYFCPRRARKKFARRINGFSVWRPSTVSTRLCFHSPPVLQLSDTPRQDRCHNLLNALNSHKDRWAAAYDERNEHRAHMTGLMSAAPWIEGSFLVRRRLEWAKRKRAALNKMPLPIRRDEMKHFSLLISSRWRRTQAVGVKSQ